MTKALQEYCETHNLELIEEYTTLGDERGSHRRAIVRDRETGEKYHLFYDRSRRKKSLAQQKQDYDIYRNGGIPESAKERGWRNTTLDNRRRAERNNQKLLVMMEEE